MPSPVVATDPVTSTNHHNNSHPSNLNSAISNGTRHLNNLSLGANSRDSLYIAPGRDAIREGKEKAKAVMAASGVNIGITTPSRSSFSDGHMASNDTTTSNGVSHSRKRSRSGSRKPMTPSKPESKEINATDEHGKYLLDLYRARDSYRASQVYEKNKFHDKLLNEKRIIALELERIAEPPRNPLDVQKRPWEAAAIYGGGFEGWGNGWTTGELRMVYPGDPSRKRPGHKTRHDRRIRYSRTHVANQAEQLEDLVPIRLDIEYDKVKLRDTFTWNLHERITDPRVFAETLVEDFNIPQEHFQHMTNEVLKTITDTVTEYYPHIYTEEEEPDSETPYFATKNDEMRIVIKLNVTIGAHTLVDQFEWDINNPQNDAEGFAKELAKDMSLSGEFTTAIAHQIREQTQMFTKSLYITGHAFDGRQIEDSDVRDNFQPSPIPSIFRPVQSAKEFIPFLYELNDDDLQHQELSILREQRRQKRSTTRRGGPALPDLKDRERTVRSLVVSSVLPGASETIEGARIFKFSRSAGRGRRANRVDGDSSDESDSEDSEPEEVTQATGGTARTRGMRGAALGAQAAMKAALGRSQTPELASLHHHETRTTSRSLRHELREESINEPTSLVVRLKINPAKYRNWWRMHQNRPKGEYQLSNQASTPLMTSQTGTPQQPSNAGSSMMPPPSPAPPGRNTPASSARATPSKDGGVRYYPDGSVDVTDEFPDESKQPPPPPWLTDALQTLRQTFPKDSFDGWMKKLPAHKTSGQQIRHDDMESTPADQITYKFFPRIKCNDCPGKVYNAKPTEVIENFTVHLNNRKHREKVDVRIGARGRGAT